MLENITRRDGDRTIYKEGYENFMAVDVGSLKPESMGRASC